MTRNGPMRIGDMGVTFERSGLLKYDQAKFEAALNKDYKAVSEVITGTYDPVAGKTNGFIDLLEDAAKTLLNQPNGTLQTRKSGLDSQISQIDRQIANRQRMITQKEEVLKAKFARLEETMSKIRGQGAGLAGLGGAVNPVQQLG